MLFRKYILKIEIQEFWITLKNKAHEFRSVDLTRHIWWESLGSHKPAKSPNKTGQATQASVIVICLPIVFLALAAYVQIRYSANMLMNIVIKLKFNPPPSNVHIN